MLFCNSYGQNQDDDPKFFQHFFITNRGLDSSEFFLQENLNK